MRLVCRHSANDVGVYDQTNVFIFTIYFQGTPEASYPQILRVTLFTTWHGLPRTAKNA